MVAFSERCGIIIQLCCRCAFVRGGCGPCLKYKKRAGFLPFLPVFQAMGRQRSCVRGSMDRAPDSGSGGWGFESLRACHVGASCVSLAPAFFAHFTAAPFDSGKRQVSYRLPPLFFALFRPSAAFLCSWENFPGFQARVPLPVCGVSLLCHKKFQICLNGALFFSLVEVTVSLLPALFLRLAGRRIHRYNGTERLRRV